MSKAAKSVKPSLKSATAHQKYVIMSHRKLRRVANVIRGKQVMEAYHMLRLMPYAAAEMLLKKLVEAANNARVKYGAKIEQLVITQALIDEGPAYRRFRPRAQGRIYRREKPTAHITLQVSVLES